MSSVRPLFCLALFVAISCAYGPGLNPSNSSESSIDPSAPAGVQSVSPTSGVRGLSIIITGTNLIAGATVTVAGGPCLNVTILSPTQLTCDLGGAAPGLGDIVVTNPGGNATTLSGAFTYRMFLYVLDDSRIEVYEVSAEGTATEIPSAHVPAEEGTTIMLIDPLGKYIYSMNASNSVNKVFSINGADGTLTQAPGSPFSQGIAFTIASPSGKVLYASGGNSPVTILAVNRATGALTQSGSAGSNVGYSLAMSPDGSLLYGNAGDDSGVYAFRADPATGALENLGRMDSRDLEYLAIDSTGTLLFGSEFGVSGQNKVIFRINPGNGSLTELGNLTDSGRFFAHPKRSFLYQEVSNDGFTYSIDVAAGTLTQVSGGGFAAMNHSKLDDTGTFAAGIYSADQGMKLFTLNQTNGKLTNTATIPGTFVLRFGFN